MLVRLELYPDKTPVTNIFNDHITNRAPVRVYEIAFLLGFRIDGRTRRLPKSCAILDASNIPVRQSELRFLSGTNSPWFNPSLNTKMYFIVLGKGLFRVLRTKGASST